MAKDDDLLEAPATAAAKKPKATKKVKAAAKPAAAAVAKKPKAATPAKAPKKAKAANGGSWSRAKNFDEIKAKVKAALGRKKEAVEVKALAESLGFDTNNVRWACRDLEKDKLAKVKLNKANRLEAVAV